VLVFDLDGEGIGGKDGFAVLENDGEACGADAMVDIIGDPDLEETLPFIANGATAIDEVLLHESHFGDVKVGRDALSIRQAKSERLIGVCREGMFEFGNGHGVGSQGPDVEAL
jgi:hypothetical protein